MNGRSPMKQMPVESFFAATCRPFGLGDLAYLALVNIGQRKQGFRQLRLIQAIEEIALVLGAVLGLEQLELTVELANAGIVAGGDPVSAHFHCMIEERP